MPMEQVGKIGTSANRWLRYPSDTAADDWFQPRRRLNGYPIQHHKKLVHADSGQKCVGSNQVTQPFANST